MPKLPTSKAPLEVQIRNFGEIAASALSRATEALGWGGKSVKVHVENAQIEASDALDLSQSAHDEIAALSGRLDELEKRIEKAEPVPSAGGRNGRG